jgi:hypothetical protein
LDFENENKRDKKIECKWKHRILGALEILLYTRDYKYTIRRDEENPCLSELCRIAVINNYEAWILSSK